MTPDSITVSAHDANMLIGVMRAAVYFYEPKLLKGPASEQWLSLDTEMRECLARLEAALGAGSLVFHDEAER